MIRILGKTVVFLGLPLGMHALMTGMYFSGDACLQSIVAPHSFNDMHPDSGREFGLLENLQHLFLAIMTAVSVWAASRKRDILEKTGFTMLALFATFVFLEEIDYGLHYYEFLMGIKWAESADTRNLHNLGDVTDLMKRAVDISIVVLFVLFSWGFGRSRYAILRYLAPDKWFTVTLLAMVAMRFVVHSLGALEREQAGPLGQVGAISRGNLSEFREFFIYYMFMIYIIVLAFCRDYQHTRGERLRESQSQPEPGHV